MPLNATSLEGESKEFAFADVNDVAFDRVHDQFQAVAQEFADTAKHPFSSGVARMEFTKYGKR